MNERSYAIQPLKISSKSQQQVIIYSRTINGVRVIYVDNSDLNQQKGKNIVVFH